MSAAAVASAIPLTADAAILEAARAEALHVDGHFHEAAEMWGALAHSGQCGWEAPLKAAASLISAGGYERAEGYLRQADRMNAPCEATRYVRAQCALLQSRNMHAFDLLAASNPEKSESADCFCLLGILEARLGRRRKAISWTKAALDTDPAHVPSLCNAVLLGMHASPGSILRKAATRAPERREPLLIAAHRTGRDSLRETLEKAAGWRAPSVLSHRYDPVLSVVAITATARCVLSQHPSIRVTWRVPVESARPTSFLLQAGFLVTHDHGMPLHGEPGPNDGLLQYDLRGVAWREESGNAVLRLDFRADSAAGESSMDAVPELELKGAWLPTPLPERCVHWTLDLQSSGWAIVTAAEPCGRAAPTVIAFRSPQRLDGKHATALGRAPKSNLAAAVATIEAALPLWQELLSESLPPKPVLAVVDEPTSTVCYTWNGLIRAPSGVACSSRHLPILIHEVGHLWWGGRVRFLPDSLWLAEALAEYTLHLAERAGLIDGYRRLTWRAVAQLCTGSGRVTRNLLALARASSPQEAYVLRAAGGYVISALEQTLGPALFRDWLRLLANQQQPIHAYDAFALASRLKGHSLNYFVHQWVQAETLPEVAIRGRVAAAGASGFHLALDCELIGATLPEVALRIEVSLADGTTVDMACDLSLGGVTSEMDCPALPIRIEPDPQRIWLFQHQHCTLEVDDERI